MARGFVWTEEAEATLLRLWDGGSSATVVGEVLGISRSSVLGKLYRLGRNRRVFTAVWTDEADAELRRLWDANLPISAIGDALGRTKGAASARLKRLKLLGTRESSISGKPRVPKAKRVPVKRGGGHQSVRFGRPLNLVPRAPEPIHKLGDDGALPGQAPIPLLARKIGKQCCWPIGDPRDPGFGVCGAPVAIDGKSYCATHALRSRMVPEVRRTPPVDYRKIAVSRVF